jgi:hypothetical protein
MGCGALEPFVYTRYDMMFLQRDDVRRVDFTSLGADGPIVLSTDNLDFDEEVVSRFLLGVPVSECAALELSYFGLQNWESNAFVATPDPTTAELFSVYSDFGTNFLTGFLDPNLLETIDYESELHNVEFNLVHRCCCSCDKELWWLWGIRYLDINEDFFYLTENDGGTSVSSSATEIETDNDLIGFQFGARGTRRFGCKLRVEGEVKAGLYANMAEQDTAISFNGSVQEDYDPVRDDQIAFVTDAGVQFSYDCCCWLTFRAGYHVLFVDGVALAPENFQPDLVSNLLLSLEQPERLNANGSVLYHGATAGLECRW